MALLLSLVLVYLLGYVNSENSTVLEAGDTCDPWEVGPWSALLEEWATSAPVHSDRHGRIMALPPTKGYYVTERIDGPLMPPPPPPPGGHIPQPGHHGYPSGTHMPASGSFIHSSGALGPPQHASGPQMQGIHVPQNYNEWEASPPPPGGKIVNRPPSPYKDKFKPSYAPPTPGSVPPRPQRPNAVDRVDEPPRKQVSETDLYLLGAIEKLVYRVDLMEKRLRKTEESLHLLVAGTVTKSDPCPSNYTRVGAACYRWGEAADWQAASRACRRQRAALLEPREPRQRRALLAALLSDPQLAGNDFWTGGLNPGLLWIWSHSGRPVEGNGTQGAQGAEGAEAEGAGVRVLGEGRCLALAHDAAARAYAFRGRDCALRLRYACQKDEDEAKLGNEIEEAARSLRLDRPRNSRVLWNDLV